MNIDFRQLRLLALFLVPLVAQAQYPNQEGSYSKDAYTKGLHVKLGGGPRVSYNAYDTTYEKSRALEAAKPAAPAPAPASKALPPPRPPTPDIAVRTCPTGMEMHSIGEEKTKNAAEYKKSLYKSLGGGPKVKVVAYDSTGHDGKKMLQIGDSDAANLSFAARQTVVAKDEKGYFASGVRVRKNQEQYLEQIKEKLAEQKAQKNVRRLGEATRNLSEKVYPRHISGTDALRFDFGGLEFTYLVVGVADLGVGETGMYRIYDDGVLIKELSFANKDKFAIDYPQGFDAIEFLIDPSAPDTSYVVSYLQYCKAATCVPTKNGNVARVSGDPHITAFTGERWDCQAHGHFTLFEGVQNNNKFKMQAIFDKKPGRTAPVTVTRAMAFESDDPKAPKVQVAVPRTVDKGCENIDFWVNDTLKPLKDGTGSEGVQLEVRNGKPKRGRKSKVLVLNYVRDGVQVTINSRASGSNGCVIDANICLSPVWESSKRKGILGSKVAGWVDRFGNEKRVEQRKGPKAFGHCNFNWCLNKTESIFTYAGSETFQTYDRCSEKYDPTLDNAVKEAEMNPAHAKMRKECADAKVNVADCILERLAEKKNGGKEADAMKDWAAGQVVLDDSVKPEGTFEADPADAVGVDIPYTPFCSVGEYSNSIGERAEQNERDYTGALFPVFGDTQVEIQAFDTTGVDMTSLPSKFSREMVVVKDSNANYAVGVETDESDEIVKSDALLIDFGGYRFKKIRVTLANLMDDEVGKYLLYKQGKKVYEATVEGKSASAGVVDAVVDPKLEFDAIVVTTKPNTDTSFLFSYLEFCSNPGVCASHQVARGWGDIHVDSFDGVDWNCQGEGLFTMFEGGKCNATKEPFSVQAIFDKKPIIQKKLTVTRKVVVDPGELDLPKVQLSVPRTSTQKCTDVKLYVNDVLTDLATGVGANPKASLSVIRDASTTKTIFLKYDDYADITLRVFDTDEEGCFHGCIIDTDICLGPHFAEQKCSSVKGLLGGKPNNNPDDDWIDSAGVPLKGGVDYANKKSKAAYDFCVKEWCVKDAAKSKFVYEAGEDFAFFNKCNEPYSSYDKEIDEMKKDKTNICNLHFADDPKELEDCLLETVLASKLGKSSKACEAKYELRHKVAPAPLGAVRNLRARV